ncbi:MAG: hypothetical protein KAU16_03255 [Methanophagales archaeon]|nr:hypothetical protein [Methanophagales archaeon]
MGRIERAPDWILKYKGRIEKGAITVEDILEAENRIRTEPIKISTVTRAINAMNYPITGLRKGKKAETEVKEEKKEEPVKGRAEPGRIERGPSWLQKYRERIEKGTITVEDILEAESRIRVEPIKISTVARAINTAGYPLTGLWRGRKAEAEVEKEKLVEKREEAEIIERGPDWLQKYRERIDKGAITAEDILEAENRIRKVPIKLITVTRAINAMGYPLTGLRRGIKAEAEVKKEKPVEKKEGAEIIERGPGWLQKYRERIEKKTITAEDILEAENKIRAEPIKISSVTRAINTMGYPLTGLRRGEKEEVKKVEKPKKAGMAEVYASSIGKISEATEKRFDAIKKSWEKDLDKSLHNDYFVNILLALAKLVEHGKTLAPAK